MATLAPGGAHHIVAGKRAFDLIGASIALLVLFPLIAAVALALAITGESVIFRHRRVGAAGEFDCLKFQTMCSGAEALLPHILANARHRAEWEAGQKLTNDPRVTMIGRFLRRTSLDELPQLFNVLRGEMSLVGPRPVTRQELDRYGSQLNAYLCRLPGITGLWQTSGRSGASYADRIALDCRYAETASLCLDVKILARTMAIVARGCGAC